MKKNGYQTSGYLGVFGLALLLVNHLVSLPGNFAFYMESQEQGRQHQTILAELEQRSELFKARRGAGLMDPHTQLIINGYIQNLDQAPNVPLDAYTTDDFVRVFDQAGLCIGTITGRRFYWLGDYKEACVIEPY